MHSFGTQRARIFKQKISREIKFIECFLKYNNPVEQLLRESFLLQGKTNTH